MHYCLRLLQWIKLAPHPLEKAPTVFDCLAILDTQNEFPKRRAQSPLLHQTNLAHAFFTTKQLNLTNLQ